MRFVELIKLPYNFECQMNDKEANEFFVPYRQLRWLLMCDSECGSDLGNTGRE